MKTYYIKFRHIVPVYLYVTLGTIVALAVIRYFLTIHGEVLDLKLEVWELWIPLILPWIPITLWLRPRLRVLLFSKESERRQFLFQVAAYLVMMASLIASQMYLTVASESMQRVKDVAELDAKARTNCYQIDSFQVLPAQGSSYADIRTSGRYDENLNIHLYFVCPIVDDTVVSKSGPFKYWYGVSFSKQINNRLETDEKERKYNAFYQECVDKMNGYAFHRVTYFERLSNSEDRDGYLNAISPQAREENNAVILEAQHERFKSRQGSKLSWALGLFVAGTGAFLLLLLWPGVDTLELGRQLAGKKPEEDDIADMVKFLIPRKPHMVTALILDLNLLVFLVMIFAGVHIISPNGLELLEWGGNRRDETISGEWWRLLTSMFVHGGIMHLALNIYGFVLASIFIEPVIGSVRYAIIYFLSGIAGSLASICWYDHTVSVGASGAIFGLFGAILATTLTGIFAKEGKKMILVLFGPYVLISLLMGLGGGIDNAAHLGGLIAGAIVALIMYKTMKRDVQEDTSLD
jgi:rhomboid protease GluP